MSDGLAAGLRRRKHALLLALQLVMLAVETFHAQSGIERLGSDALRTVLGIAIWIVIFEHPRERALFGAVLLASVAINWGRYFVPNMDHTLSRLADQLVLSLYLWSAVWVILRDLFRKPPAGAENVFGAICGYLIAGNAWARINATAYLLVPSAYSISPEIAAFVPDSHGRLALFTYYGFTQMMTIGYSDVTPVRAPATTLSLFAGLFGMFYTAVVVAQFVDLAQRPKGQTPTHP